MKTDLEEIRESNEIIAHACIKGGLIYNVHVNRSRRRKGIGTRLMQRIVEKYKFRGLFLYVKPENLAAKRLYEKVGFKFVMPDPEGDFYVLPR